VLSASRSSDFKSCPLKYRFRVIDRLPERPSPAAVRGTVVHAVLERLFDLPAPDRTPAAAVALLATEWAAAREADPALDGMFAGDDELATWLDSARDLLRTYFTLEDPRQVEPAEREAYVRGVLPDVGIEIHGYLDRVDVAADGSLLVTDYKTARSPKESYEEQALFQMKFYALLLWRTRGTLPRRMRLVYLGDGVHATFEPDPDNLARFERSQLGALARAIGRATETGDWRPRTSKLCDWCDFQAYCPAYGGTPPPLPVAEVAARLADAPVAVCDATG
jgi:putative RecB family exonuclease